MISFDAVCRSFIPFPTECENKSHACSRKCMKWKEKCAYAHQASVTEQKNRRKSLEKINYFAFEILLFICRLDSIENSFFFSEINKKRKTSDGVESTERKAEETKREHLYFRFCFIFSFAKTDSGSGKGISSNSQNRIQSSDSPLFTTRNNTRIIAQRGGLAVLPCSVKWSPTATVRMDFRCCFFFHFTFLVPALLHLSFALSSCLSFSFVCVCMHYMFFPSTCHFHSISIFIYDWSICYLYLNMSFARHSHKSIHSNWFIFSYCQLRFPFRCISFHISIFIFHFRQWLKMAVQKPLFQKALTVNAFCVLCFLSVSTLHYNSWMSKQQMNIHVEKMSTSCLCCCSVRFCLSSMAKKKKNNNNFHEHIL